jgi:hypothetical protein
LLLAPGVSSSSENKWQGYLELLGKPGTERSLGQADLLVPVTQDANSLLFLNLRGQLDDQDSEEFNIGLGYRRLYSEWIFGAWGFFDTRNTENGNNFKQGNIGLEMLSQRWDPPADFISMPMASRIFRGPEGGWKCVSTTFRGLVVTVV